MWTLLGLILNFAGTVLVAFSFKRGTVMAWQEKDKNPKMQYMIYYSPSMFKLGIFMIASGFIFQIAGLIISKFVHS
jgi:hypothetical protein